MPGSSPGMTVWVVDSGLRAFPAIPSPPGRDRVGGRGVDDRGSEALGIERDIAYRQALAQLQESAGGHQAAGARALQEVDVEAGADGRRHRAGWWGGGWWRERVGMEGEYGGGAEK